MFAFIDLFRNTPFAVVAISKLAAMAKRNMQFFQRDLSG